MENRKPIHESEYAVLSPVERHAKLVELYQLLPKPYIYAEWSNASDEQDTAIKKHNDEVKDKIESSQEFDNFFATNPVFKVDLEQLKEKGDVEMKRRANSEDKKILIGRVTELLEFSPTTDEFKHVVVKFFGYYYDAGRDFLNNSDDLSRLILLKDAQSGGFFNQKHASDIEVLAYKQKKSDIAGLRRWNGFIEYFEGKIGVLKVEKEILRNIHYRIDEEEVMFLDKWEQAIKDRYHIDPQVQSADTPRV